MPELPEVETVRRGLQPVLEGSRIVRVETRRPDLRFPFPERFGDRIAGRTVLSLGRRAKYLVAHLEGGPVLICHLGMSGSFRIETEAPAEPLGDFHYPRSKDSAHDHVVFHVHRHSGEDVRVVFNDPRRFGFMLLCDETTWRDHPMLAGDPQRDRRGDRGRRLVAARLCPGRRLARLLPAFVQCLRSRGRGLPAARMRRNDRTDRPGRPIDLPLSRLPALGTIHFRALGRSAAPPTEQNCFNPVVKCSR